MPDELHSDEEPQSDAGIRSRPDLARAFRDMWIGASDKPTANAELLPVRLTRACVAVLGVAGAGLSIHEADIRVPVGASDEVATLAERLQFTQGEGPCIEAATTRRLSMADATQMEDDWPAFADELFRHTPYRAIVSLPLAITAQTFAALDLFLLDSGSLHALSLSDVGAVSDEVVGALAAAVHDTVGPGAPELRPEADYELDPDILPVWLTAGPAQARTYVWVAMGMAMTEFRLGAADALAVLRSYSYGHEMLLDDVARSLTEGRIRLAELQP